jgi:hypothetical protein
MSFLDNGVVATSTRSAPPVEMPARSAAVDILEAGSTRSSQENADSR